jgi:putative transcriptional regulator
MQSDGTLVRIKSDGTEERVTVTPPKPMSDEAITAAALRDPDAQPLTDADLAHMKQVPRIKTLRRALGLTQEEFAARYHIPLGTLRDWEQGRCEPDQPARAYLTVIAHDPEGVQRALQARPHSAACFPTELP